MDPNELVGKVQTVLGPIAPEALGVTLTHEHLLIDMSVWFEEPLETKARAMAFQPVTLETLGWIRYHQHNNLDNVRLLDEAVAIEEAHLYRLAGGGTLVDVTNVGLGRNPHGLVRIARATGLHIVMGSGYYVGLSHPSDLGSKTDEEIAAEIAADVGLGVEGSGIRAGIIGEIGCSWPLTDDEKKVLRASAQAQRLTGAPLAIHPGLCESAVLEIIEILACAGAALDRTVTCHFDRVDFDRDVSDATGRLQVAEECAKAGCWIEYDLFGHEGYYELSLGTPRRFDVLSDWQRIEDISKLIDRGYVHQLLLGQDCCMKQQLRRYGGQGYAHILENIEPRMRAQGISEGALHAMLVENPRTLLTFAQPRAGAGANGVHDAPRTPPC